MATTDDSVRSRTQDAFPVDNPVQALQRDHDLVRKLADAYRNTQSADVRKQAATQLIQAIHMHSRLEEGVFYPGVRRVDPNLIARFEEDHLAVDDLLATLQGMSLEEARTEPLVRELIDAVLSHIRQEEEQLFPELKQAALDLTSIGMEMQAFEANLVHMQAQLSDQATRR
ncbi:hemerythrin domain-containing protein [Telluria sp. Tellsp104]